MATIRFYLNPKKGYFDVMAMISHGTKKERAKALGYNVPSKNKCWDSKKQLTKNCEYSADINSKISRWRTIFSEYKGRVLRDEIEFDFDEIIELMSNPTGKKKKKQKSALLIDVAEQFLLMQTSINEDGTTKQYRTMVSNLKDYQEYTGKKYVLSDVDKEFYREYGSWLIATQNNINNTVNKKITRIITMMAWAFEKKLIDNKYFEIRFNFKGNDSDAHPPLLPDEIEKLHNAEPGTESQKTILDAFIFACYTGLRISDIRQLQGKHVKVHKDKDGSFHYIDFTQEKTTNANTVPINGKAVQILESHRHDGLIFDLPEEQYVNRYLKEAAGSDSVKLNRQIEIVYNKGAETIKEFKKLSSIISFHCGRSSYITNALAAGVNPIFVQLNAGHSDLKTTMSYSTQEDVNRMKETLKIQDR